MTTNRPFDAGVPALVLRLDRNPFHHGTLGAVRSLGRAGVEVHAVVEAADSPVVRSRFLRGAHLAPAGRLTSQQFTELLLRVSDRIGAPAVLIAMDDLSAIHTAASTAVLGGRYLLPSQPVGLPGLLADKAELAELCERAGIGHPRTVVPQSADEAAEAVRGLGLPLVAKWSRPWLLGAQTGLRSTTLVRSAAAAQALYQSAESAGSRLLLQRHVPDGPRTDWFFHGYFADAPTATAAAPTRQSAADAVGPHCLVGGSGVKELSWPARTGLTARGRWQSNPEVEDAARRLVRHVGYRGILDLDFRRDRATGAYQLLDVNPRPGAQFRLFTDLGGLDVVRAQYLDLTGQQVPESVGRPGRVFVAENYCLLSALVSVGERRRPADRDREGESMVARESQRGRCADLGPSGGAEPAPRGGSAGTRHRPGPWRVPQPGVETAWFAGDDPLPFLAMVHAWLGRGLAKAIQRLRSGHAPVAPSAPRPREPDSATVRP
ncbi:ATP-grasp domain-containing protein [Streptomyces albipurpureus]|uniref:ATP-grasp domain-containing protein n=1 Tax=Streptomyces albipurpureus TaxID=2897419 RepID=A0ABT0UKQ8_9ACTN|nr:ATP-grasp domain-containing protein [Streptomyces sp. CWNU-1]MCM2389202.1 ATP-grasp domain-containing protein [Streptomyces sp. CWNU-1]